MLRHTCLFTVPRPSFPGGRSYLLISRNRSRNFRAVASRFSIERPAVQHFAHLVRDVPLVPDRLQRREERLVVDETFAERHRPHDLVLLEIVGELGAVASPRMLHVVGDRGVGDERTHLLHGRGQFRPLMPSRAGAHASNAALHVGLVDFADRASASRRGGWRYRGGSAPTSVTPYSAAFLAASFRPCTTMRPLRVEGDAVALVPVKTRIIGMSRSLASRASSPDVDRAHLGAGDAHLVGAAREVRISRQAHDLQSRAPQSRPQLRRGPRHRSRAGETCGRLPITSTWVKPSSRP